MHVHARTIVCRFTSTLMPLETPLLPLVSPLALHICLQQRPAHMRAHTHTHTHTELFDPALSQHTVGS